jgi:putative ABC transport system permease protein
VVLVNESAAAKYWPDEDPIGQRITIVGHIFREPTPGERLREIVGVVADARQWSPQSEPHPVIYVPSAQQPREVLTVGRRAGQSQRLMRMSFVLKTTGEPMQWAAPAQRAIAEVDPEQPVPVVESLDTVVGRWTAGLRFYTLIGGAFAVVGLLLAAVGMYATLAYYVTGRTHEIGVRMALGAGRRGVAGLVVREGLVLAGIGLALGLPVAAWLSRLVPALVIDPLGGDEMLFEVSPTEPLTFVAVITLILGVVALACYRPARRATGVDPMIALRSE